MKPSDLRDGATYHLGGRRYLCRIVGAVTTLTELESPDPVELLVQRNGFLLPLTPVGNGWQLNLQNPITVADLIEE